MKNLSYTLIGPKNLNYQADPSLTFVLPNGYLSLLDRFGSGEFFDDYLLVPPDVLDDYSHLTNSDNCYTKNLKVFINGYSGDHFAWDTTDSKVVHIVEDNITKLNWTIESWPEKVLESPYLKTTLKCPYFISQGSMKLRDVWQALSPGDDLQHAHSLLQKHLIAKRFTLLESQQSDEVCLSKFLAQNNSLIIGVQSINPALTNAPFDTRLTAHFDDPNMPLLIKTVSDIFNLGWALELESERS